MINQRTRDRDRDAERNEYHSQAIVTFLSLIQFLWAHFFVVSCRIKVPPFIVRVYILTEQLLGSPNERGVHSL